MKLAASITLNVFFYLPVYVMKEYEVISKQLYSDIVWILTVILGCLVLFAFRKLIIYWINFCFPEGKIINLKQDICEREERLKYQTPQTPGYNRNRHKLNKLKNKLKQHNETT